jgi:hypothetical protein
MRRRVADQQSALYHGVTGRRPRGEAMEVPLSKHQYRTVRPGGLTGAPVRPPGGDATGAWRGTGARPRPVAPRPARPGRHCRQPAGRLPAVAATPWAVAATCPAVPPALPFHLPCRTTALPFHPPSPVPPALRTTVLPYHAPCVPPAPPYYPLPFRSPDVRSAACRSVPPLGALRPGGPGRHTRPRCQLPAAVRPGKCTCRYSLHGQDFPGDGP